MPHDSYKGTKTHTYKQIKKLKPKTQLKSELNKHNIILLLSVACINGNKKKLNAQKK